MTSSIGRSLRILVLPIVFIVAACQDAPNSGATVEDALPMPGELTLESLRGDWLGSIEVAPDIEIHMAIQIIEKADGSLGANFASPDQGQDYVADTFVELDGNELTLNVETFGITIEGFVSEDRSTIEATISQGRESDPIDFERVSELPRTIADRPQTPKPPFPYISQDVKFENSSDGIWFGGTLTLPSDSGRVPAVVFVSGSGPNHRDYGNDHKLPMVVADYLARKGIALLRYDKRGVYESTGRYAEADEAALARDAQAALSYLLSREGIDPTRVGFIGHSEGSQIAARAVSELGADAAFIVSMAGVGLTALETTVLQDGTESAAAGASPEEVSVLVNFSGRFYDTVLKRSESEETLRASLRALYDDLEGVERETVLKWYGSYGKNTLSPFRASRDVFVASMRGPAPTIYWREIDVPVLVLNGGKDSQVPAREHVEALMGVLTRPNSTSKVFPEVNHMFQTADTGAVEEYKLIDETIATEVLVFVTDWLLDLD